MPHHTPPFSSPQGRLVHQAARYDWRVRLYTLGRGQQLRKRMADLLPLHDGDAVLDVGCGTGDLAIEVVKRVGARGQVVGIDGSEEMIARARHKAQRRHLPVEFRLEQAEALAFPDHIFDVVVSSLVFHALPGSLKLSALTSIARVLKAGGHLTIIDFLNASGHVLTHSAHPADPHDLPSLLRLAGFQPVQRGRLPFLTVGIPPLGFVSALLPQQSERAKAARFVGTDDFCETLRWQQAQRADHVAWRVHETLRLSARSLAPETTTVRTRAGCVAASRTAVSALIENPSRWGRSSLRAPITPAASSVSKRGVKAVPARSERPCPLVSMSTRS